MGMSLWVFIWLIDKTTLEYTDEHGVRWGRVLGGKPIKYQDIVNNLKISLRTAKYYIATLRRENYIRIKRHSYGIAVEVRNSRKWVSRSAKSCPSIPEVQDVGSPEVQDLASRSAKFGIANPPNEGQLTVSSKDITGLKYIYVEDDEPLRLATLLKALILKRKPDYRWGTRSEPNLQTWAREIDLMIRRDGRDSKRIEEVIRWCQEDAFWCKNICSADKLRKQFSRLEDDMIDSRKFQRPELEYENVTGHGDEVQ